MGEIVDLRKGQPKKGAAPAAEGTWETWDGGRYWLALDGTRTYYIRRRVNGRRYEIRTAATTGTAAHELLKRFEADPEAFDPRGEVKATPIYLDEKLSTDFLAWSKRPKKDGGAGNTLRWAGQQKLYLATWAEHLGGVDLRRVDLARDVLPALKGATCRPQRIAVIKRLYSWLRKVEHRIKPAEDPTFGTLAVPQYQPAQQTRSKARSKKELDKVRRHLGDRWRNILDFLLATGAHVSEAERFAASGRVEVLPTTRKGGARGPVGVAGVVVIPKTKTGGEHRVAVSKAGLAAAQQLLKEGPFDQSNLRKALAAASEAAKVPNVTPGTMRHTTATAAVNAGNDMQAVADALHHADKRTTARWYATLATPAKIKTLV